MPTKEQLETLNTLFTTMRDSLTKKDFLMAWNEVLKHIKSFEASATKDIAAVSKQLSEYAVSLGERTDKSLADIKQEAMAYCMEHMGEMMQKMDAKMASMKDGEDGESPDPEEIKKEIMAELPTKEELISLIPMEGPKVRDALELLPEGEKLSIDAIENLQERLDERKVGGETRVIGGHGPLWGLEDVDVAGIVVGQSIKWDGVRWIPFTPSGANTAVYNEVVSGSGTTFTLAHTPVSGTDRIYANGQRLVPTTDYTIAGATITTVLSWSAGQITADYEY